MISFDKLSSKNIPFIADHIIIFLLFGFLLLRCLNDLLHMIYVILLILDDLFVALNLSFGPILICLDFDIFSFNLFVIFVKLDKLLILIFYFFSQLLNCISHTLIFFLEFTNLFL